MEGRIVYQHSGFDRSAISAACGNANLSMPSWDWRDSVHVARTAWPELRGNGGHGLASLKRHLGLVFEHHDAGEDARAAAEVVLHAEGLRPAGRQAVLTANGASSAEDFELIEDDGDTVTAVPASTIALAITPVSVENQRAPRRIGTAEITQANLDYNHIYLRNHFEHFPADAIGGSNRALAARREIAVDWGGVTAVMTDLDGTKRFFRKRGWIGEFFARNGAKAGDTVSVDEIAPYAYRVTLQRCGG